MPKTIVTHIAPDFDGIPAIWLLKKFHPDFEDAKVAFVPAGTTLGGMEVDSDPDIVHVDTGMGKFDHHETNAYTCGAKLVWQWLKKDLRIKDEAVDRIVELATALDHAKDNEWPDPADDKWELSINAILTGWKLEWPGQNEKYVELGMIALDGLYAIMRSKVAAEAEIEKAVKFKTKWGTALASSTGGDNFLDLAIRQGYVLAVTKDRTRGFVRITGASPQGVDLTKAYEQFKKLDPDASWFLHASKVLLRNGSNKNPSMVPTKLSLLEVMDVLKKTS